MKKHSIHTALCNILYAVLAFLVVLALPTGWLYDLWAGTGTEQGQQPGGGVQQLQRQEEIEPCFLGSTPVTVAGGELTPCPLARLPPQRRRKAVGVRFGIYHSELPSPGLGICAPAGRGRRFL